VGDAQREHIPAGDIGDAGFIRAVCDEVRPVAAIHFAAFIEVGESVENPQKYFTNNRDKAKVFFDTLAEKSVKNIVFSSTAAVYGEITDSAPIRENRPTRRSIPTANRSWMRKRISVRSKR